MDSTLNFREAPGAAGPQTGPAGEPARGLAIENERGAQVVCAECGNLVTTVAEKTSVEGRHHHRFMNPDGLHFEIACFLRAPGTIAVGESSSVWTWFPGYVWQAVVCAACMRHLGWSYSRGPDGFFGLISARIVELSAHPD